MIFTRTQKVLIGFIFILGGAGISVWNIDISERLRNTLTVAFLDIGQGDSIFVESPTGQQILFDSGPDAKVLQELGKVMPWYDHSIDAIVITNPDKDHIAGFIDVLKRYRVSYVFEPGTNNISETYRVLEDLIKEKKVEKVLAKRGMKIILGPDTAIKILFPNKDVSEEKSNDGSIVAKVEYGSTTVLLTGDATKKVETVLADLDKENLKSGILKVGHHGSKTSTSEKFLSLVKPEFAVISSGKANKYGHPNAEVIDILNKFSVKVLRTDELGTIIMKSDGQSLFVKK